MWGRVKFFNEERGFGFVENEGGEWFLHATDTVDGYVPQRFDEVDFLIGDGRRGDAAVDVRLTKSAPNVTLTSRHRPDEKKVETAAKSS